MRTHTELVVLALATLSLAACSVEDIDEELGDEDIELRGFKFANGLKLANGLKFANGLKLANGASLDSGLATGTGLSVASALNSEAGLSTTTGLMKSEEGQTLIKYLVECALPAGHSITKTDTLHGGSRVFSGAIGLGAAWKTGACTAACQEAVSACLLARTNEIGTSVLIDMRSPIAQIGTASSGAQFTIQEGAFFGNLFANPPKAFACKGVDGSFGMFEGRTCANFGTCGMQGLAGHCRDSCTPAPGKTFTNCKVGATTFAQVITTYLDPTPWSVGCPPGCDACYNGTCTFVCTPGAPCNNQVLDCPDGWACETVCDGASACASATVDCRGTNECFATCTTANNCAGMQVTCGAGDCDLACEVAGACNGTKLTVTGAGDGYMLCKGGLSTGELCVDQGAGVCTKSGC